MNRYLRQSTVWLLCLGALAFPFSVALTNATFGIAIALSVVSGQFLQGLRLMRQTYAPLLFALAAYLLLILLGLLWSQDIGYGFKVVSHQWTWLLLPALATISLGDDNRNRLLLFLSAGLTLHLAYCVLQRYGVVTPPNVGGSNLRDATGYIGHIGFGFVYAVWGGWLLQRGWLQHGWLRWVQWLLAAWAFAMIFLAQGRSGYLVAIAILLTLFLKHVISELGWKRSTMAAGLLCALLVIIATGPAKDRIQETWSGIDAAMHGDLKQAEARWVIWYGTVKTLESAPLLGVGTGGFPSSYKETIRQSPELTVSNGGSYHHPHNLYLQSLVRWSMPGVIVVLALLAVWLRTGWKAEWAQKPDAGLILLSGIAVLVHGLSAASLEEHFPALLAIFMLGQGLGSGISGRRSLPG